MSQGPGHSSAPALPGKNPLTLGGLKGTCARQNDGCPNMPMSSSLKLETTVFLPSKMDFTGLALKRGDYPGLSGWDEYNHKDLRKGRQEDPGQRRRDFRRGQDSSKEQQAKKCKQFPEPGQDKETNYSLGPPERMQSCQHLDVWT